MENLQHLRRTCRSHLFPTALHFSHWAGPYRATYVCPSCNRSQTFQRDFRFGPVRRVA